MRVTTTVHDVAAYILGKQGPISSMKLQKLCYYSQAWHLVWADEPLFAEPIQAWANGPVVYELFQAHKGRYTVGPEWPRGQVGRLDKSQTGTIEAVLSTYGGLTGRQLSVLTHAEGPWKQAREGLSSTAPSSEPIALEEMSAFYSALELDDEATPVDELVWSDWETAGA